MKLTTRSIAAAGLVVSICALVVAMTGAAGAKHSRPAPSVTPKPYGTLLLNAKRKFPASVIPKVRAARRADRLGGRTLKELTASCDNESVDLGSFCVMAASYVVSNEDAGKNNFFWATQRCAEAGGYLPSAAELIAAAPVVRLASTLTDSTASGSVDDDPNDGLKDRREMSSTLVTTAAGSSAAGSVGVSEGSRGNPLQAEPDPVPAPANPTPETLQYVTVYDNGDKGGFGGSKPVGQAERFRCAFAKKQHVDEGSIG